MRCVQCLALLVVAVSAIPPPAVLRRVPAPAPVLPVTPNETPFQRLVRLTSRLTSDLMLRAGMLRMERQANLAQDNRIIPCLPGGTICYVQTHRNEARGMKVCPDCCYGFNYYELSAVGSSRCKSGTGPTPAPRVITPSPTRGCLPPGRKCYPNRSCFFECPPSIQAQLCAKCCVATNPPGHSESTCNSGTPKTPKPTSPPRRNCIASGTQCYPNRSCFFECPPSIQAQLCSKCCTTTNPSGYSKTVCN